MSIATRSAPCLLLGACLALLGSVDRQPSEVLLIGTIHHLHLIHPDNTPSHLGATLREARPDLVAVENLPDWSDQGRHFWVHLPEYSVVEAYRSTHGGTIGGIDWVPEIPCFWSEAARDPARVEQRLASLMAQAEWEKELAEDPSWGLAAVQDRIELERMEPSSAEVLEDSAARVRVDRLAANIVALAEAHPGRRIAVLIGSSQLYPLADRLRAYDGVRLLDGRAFIPDEAAVRAATLPEDRIVQLGSLLDRWFVPAVWAPESAIRADSLLTELVAADRWVPVAEYYRARLEYLLGDRLAAQRRLDGLLAVIDDTHLPGLVSSEWAWPPWDRLEWKAKFVRATLHDLAGRHSAAAEIYAELIATVPANRLRPRFRGPYAFYDLVWYLRDLIEDPYKGGVTEALRAQAALRCWGEEGMSADAWPR